MTTFNYLSALDLLRSDGSIVVNKKLVKAIGLSEAVIFSELVSLRSYWEARGQLTDGEWFFCTRENLEDNTGIPARTADRKVKELEKLGLIVTQLKGLPAKKYFRITNKFAEILGLIETKVENKVCQNGEAENNAVSEQKDAENVDLSSVAKMAKQELPKWRGNNTKTNNTKTNKDIDDDDIGEKSPLNLIHANASSNQIENEIKAPTANEPVILSNTEMNEIITDLREITKDNLTDRSFNTIVKKVVDKHKQGKVNSFREYLMASLLTKIEELEVQRAKEKAEKEFRENALKQMNNVTEKRPIFYNWLDERED